MCKEYGLYIQVYQDPPTFYSGLRALKLKFTDSWGIKRRKQDFLILFTYQPQFALLLFSSSSPTLPHPYLFSRKDKMSINADVWINDTNEELTNQKWFCYCSFSLFFYIYFKVECIQRCFVMFLVSYNDSCEFVRQTQWYFILMHKLCIHFYCNFLFIFEKFLMNELNCH